MVKFTCYVGGCDEPTEVGAIHKLFGRVASCRGHNPVTHGYDLPFGYEPATRRAAAPAEAAPAVDSPAAALTSIIAMLVDKLADRGDEDRPGGRVRRPAKPKGPVPPSVADVPDRCAPVPFA